MVTVLWECSTEEQYSVVRFLWAEGLTAEDIHEEKLLIYGGKCLLHKVFHNWVTDVLLMTEVRKWLRQQTSMLQVLMHW
jgi:hypothetical protein